MKENDVQNEEVRKESFLNSKTVSGTPKSSLTNRSRKMEDGIPHSPYLESIKFQNIDSRLDEILHQNYKGKEKHIFYIQIFPNDQVEKVPVRCSHLDDH